MPRLDGIRYVALFGYYELIVSQLMGTASDTSIPIPDVAEPTVTSSCLAQRCPAVCVLQCIQTREYATEQGRRFRDLLCQRGR